MTTGSFSFDASLRRTLEANLRRHERIAFPLEGRRHAAVAVIVVDSDPDDPGGDDVDTTVDGLPALSATQRLEVRGSLAGTAGGPAVVLTKRAAKLRAHAGQWALPGGRVDEGETPLDAARREVREELGFDLPASALIGMLDDYPTRSGYVITPFVFWGGDDPVLRPHAAEVLSVHRIAFTELCRPDSPRFITIPESDRPVVQVPIGERVIHAPTGAVVLQFRRVAIEGVSERVADYEQPLFAWK